MKQFSFEEAMAASVKYFNGDELAAKVFLDKYALKDNQENLLEDSPEMMHHRIAKEFARIEKGKFKNPLTEKEIFDLLDRFRYIIPQGSPMYGIGNNHQIISLSNCFVIEPPADSYGGIMRADEHLVQISKRRGGTGTMVSNLRPAGAETKNAAKSSTGLVSFSERFSNSIREVGQNGRRGALMLTCNIHHPESVIIPEADSLLWDKPEKILIKGDINKGERDIETLSSYYNPNKLDFASMKLDRKLVTGANVSIALTDEFLKAVATNKDYEQRFPVDSPNPKISKKVNARNAWQKIIHMAWQSAEPGLLFWDRIVNYNAVDCYAHKGFKTVSTNPCSEIPLCPNDSCRLLVVNLLSFVKMPFTKDAEFDFHGFAKVTYVAQRLMDNLIDLEVEKIEQIISKIKADPEPIEIKSVELKLWEQIKVKCLTGRRTGLGITALGDMLAALGLKYDSKEAIGFADKVFMKFKHAAFDSTAEMAKELGAFPIWDWNIEKNSEFLLQIKSENPDLYSKMAKYGRRNIGLLTLAPTGTVSIMTQTTSGGEPLFSLKPYIRRKKINPNDKHIQVDFVDTKGDSWQHFEVYHPQVEKWMQTTGQKDTTKSPWFGCTANDINWEKRVKIQAVIQKHLDHAISSTVNLPSTATEADVAKIYETAWRYGCKGITVYRDGCRSGVLVNKVQSGISKNNAPKRPKELQGEIFAVNHKRDKLYVAVGFLGDDVYEVFTGVNNHDEIKHSKGIIRKNTRGKYDFIYENNTFHLNNGHNDDSADALTRVISGGLRHGMDMSFIVHQLEKTQGDLTSFAKVLARVLKKYIKDGTKISGENCAVCGGELSRENGCVTCKSCGNSKCG
jgi:ribonucleoside-diphosphate reductase alpha chain